MKHDYWSKKEIASPHPPTPLQPLFSTNTQVNECLKDQTHTNHLVTKKEFPSTISKHFQKTPTSILRNVVP